MNAIALICLLLAVSIYWAHAFAGLPGVATLACVAVAGWIILRVRPRPQP